MGEGVTYNRSIQYGGAEAEWSLWVNYKGVTYRKEIDENGQEYYYVHEKDDESAVPETTINTLPVR